MTSEKTEKMRAIRDEVVADSTLPLYQDRLENNYKAVLGEGNHDAHIVFIGEAPGKNEAETGRPFCGTAGKILDELLQSISVPRNEVYITNIVKDRPPGNRDPLPSEIDAYTPFLDRQLSVIAPKAIAPLGRFSMEYIMKKFDLDLELEPISRAHGKKYVAQTPWGAAYIVPLYHPAAAIYKQDLKETLKEDFKVLKEFV